MQAAAAGGPVSAGVIVESQCQQVEQGRQWRASSAKGVVEGETCCLARAVRLSKE